MDLCEFETSLVYRVSSRTAKATQRNPFLKKTKTKTKQKPKQTKKTRQTCVRTLWPLGDGKACTYAGMDSGKMVKRCYSRSAISLGISLDG